MLWLMLLLCLGLVGMSGYYRGGIRASFSFVGLVFGLVLAKPLSPLAARLLPLIGWEHPVWRLFVPEIISFVFVLTIFKIAGHNLHQKAERHYNLEDKEALHYLWERMQQRLGLCVGLLNGAIYFFILLMPVYAGGYFTTEAAGANLPASARLLTNLRASLHDSKLDRVVAAYDPIPTRVYLAGDIIDLMLQNPPLQGRLVRYPPLLVLAETKEIKDIGADSELQKMIQSQPTVSDLLAQPKIQALVTNAAISDQIQNLLGPDLPDLQTWLMTDKSPKYDSQAILGIWTIDLRGSLEEVWKQNPNLTARQFVAMRTSLLPLLRGLSLTARLDNQFILKKQRPDGPEATAVALGTWKNSGESYEITLPGNNPDTTVIAPNQGRLQIPRDGHILLFTKES